MAYVMPPPKPKVSKKNKIKLSIHDDFKPDGIIFVIGHSDVRAEFFKPKTYEDVSVVTILGAPIGTSCFVDTPSIHQFAKRVNKSKVSTIAIELDSTLRIDTKYREDEDLPTFLRSTVEINRSRTQYYEKEWEFLEKRKHGYENTGSAFLYVGNEMHSLLDESELGPFTDRKSLVLNKTEIIKRASKYGNHFVFIDLGCNGYETGRETITKQIHKNALAEYNFGGKKTKRKLWKMKSLLL